MLLPTHQQPTVVAEPDDGPRHDSAVVISAQRPTIMGATVRLAVVSVRSDNFDAEIRRGIGGIGAVAFVAGQPFRLTHLGKQRRGLLRDLRFSELGGRRTDVQRNPWVVNHHRDFRAFAFAVQTAHAVTTRAPSKCRVDEALSNLHLPAFDQLGNQRRNLPSEAMTLTPAAQIIVRGRLRRKALWQKASLHAGVLHEQSRLKYRPRIRQRPPKRAAAFNP